MKTHSKLITFTALGMFALASSTALAATVSDGSSLNLNRNSVLNFIVRNTGTANINNSVTSVSSTGNNTISAADDADDVSVRTGAADAGAGVQTTANSSSVTADITTHTVDVLPDITVTDESSANVNTNDVATQDITNDNVANTTNSMAAVADTGSNGIFSGDGINGASIVTGRSVTTSALMEALNNVIVNIRFRRLTH
ncbi:MAG TPA: hypothetical protein VEA59_02565 [Patescibacteria group bacterium]|nr:hypothetical protein [Patescibacteria group bacterium]